MSDDTMHAIQPPRKTWTSVLFNPFQYVAGGMALVIGLGLMVAAAYIGSISHTHFDGVLDVHSGLKAPTWFFLVEVLIGWLSLVAFLAIAGLIAAQSRFRLVDILGTQALARGPMVLAAAVFLLPGVQRFTTYLLHKLPTLTQSPPAAPADLWKDLPLADAFVFATAMIVTLLMTIWMVALMYRGYAVSCNLRRGRAVISFITALIAAEVAAKLAIVAIARTTGILS